jgi:PHD/YefM family antitoxin component YafN of YafNO toxin-antitoxin module
MEMTVLPVVGEASATLRAWISGGQPVVLTDPDGRAVAVVLDVDSYEEAEDALAVHSP